MTVAVIYPVPMDSPEVWETFKPFVKRFCDTYRQFHPSYNTHEIYVVLNKGELNDEISEMFNNMPVRFAQYSGDGFDLGTHQWMAKKLEPETFTICMTTRCYFWCDSWLWRLASCREQFGRGLYGCFASKESGHLHICTRAFCMDAQDWQEYPVEITSRDQGVFVECGEGCLLDWFESRELPAMIVHRDGPATKGAWFEVKNRFRNGDQSNVLIKDRHTDIYQDADAEERKRLAAMADGE